MANTRGGTTVPIGTSVAQETISDGTNVWPSQHNKSNSGGFDYFAFSTATTQAARVLPGRVCRLHIPGTGGTLGNITLRDNALGDTSGQVIWGPTSPSAGQIIDIQAPLRLGLSIQTAAATVGFVTFE